MFRRVGEGCHVLRLYGQRGSRKGREITEEEPIGGKGVERESNEGEGIERRKCQ